MNCTLEYINNWLKANLDNERYAHSLGTAECAQILAKTYCPDKIEKAYLAGLIHDCAKCIDKSEMKRILENLIIDEDELDSPKTHHAPVGAYLAKKEFGINDEEILSAIRWHTIGCVKMSVFDKIIFLADKIEERTRPSEIINPIKDALKKENGLNQAMLVCYKGTIKSLVDRNLRICTKTIDIYNNLL